MIKTKEKSFKRKNELIEAALDEFATKSYENASLNKIIKNAGISKGTFYYHFKDKKALYLFLQESAYKFQMEFQDKRMKELAGDPQKSKDFWDPENSEGFKQKDFFEKIILSAQIGAEAATRFPKHLKLTMMFFKEEENEDTKEIIEYVNSFRKKTLEEGVEKMVTDAIEDGDLSNRFSKDFIVKVVNHFFLHYNEIFGMDEDYDESKFLKDINTFVDFLKFGLGR